eukprot:4476890-Pyramimonas_sp.AAC.1
MLGAIVPWRIGHEDSEEEFDRTFDPKKPCLYMTEGSYAEKAQKMKELLLQYCIVPLITAGPDASDAILRFCTCATTTFGKKPD